MSSPIFRVQEHTLDASHIRDRVRATAHDQEEVLQLAIKQYTPKEHQNPNEQGVTIIGAHANGFPKELYEPLWDELYIRLKRQGIHIRSIWIADVAHQGASGVLNERKLGNDPSWFDHPRDLFLMVNHFRQHMKRPIVGIGHSLGGNNLVNLSIMHPRLFATLVLIDPVFVRFLSGRAYEIPAMASVHRRDLWPSRKVAREKMGKSKFFQTWDQRVFDRWIQYGLRDLPTHIHPRTSAPPTVPPVISASASVDTVPPAQDDEREVTLTTSKHQEVLTFTRANFPTKEYPNPNVKSNPITHPEAHASKGRASPFYRPEGSMTFDKLPFIRPSTFYIFGDPKLDEISTPVMVADKLATTGTGIGGSGGAVEGRVKAVVVQGVGHMVPMEAVGETANHAASWLKSELDRWREIEEKEMRDWSAVAYEDRSKMSAEFIQVMNGLLPKRQPAPTKQVKAPKL